MLLRHLLTLPIWFATAASLSAATFVVTNANDSGAGSLREALTQANSNAQADTISFDATFFSTARTITLTSGELRITRDDDSFPGRLVTINGPGADLLTISGNNSSRVFYVSNFGNVALSGVTIAGGNGIGTVLNEEGNSGGGLLAHSSFVSLSDVTFRNNAAPNAGGAIYFSSMRNIALANTLITENTAAFGGGIYDVGDTPATTQRVYTDVTISNNTARNREGGASMSAGTTTMTNCRITGNKARSAQPAAGAAGNAGMLLSGGVATITDTVISGNVAGAVPSAEFPNGVYGVNGGLNINATLCVLKRVTVSGNIDHQTGVAAGAGMKLHAVGDITITGERLPGFQQPAHRVHNSRRGTASHHLRRGNPHRRHCGNDIDYQYDDHRERRGKRFRRRNLQPHQWAENHQLHHHGQRGPLQRPEHR
jgi:predicted outer membrane repeat protein